MARRLALVTGASSGIGAAYAREFARRGWDLALVARREDRLKDLAEELKAQFGVDSLVIAADLSEPDAPETIVKTIHDQGRIIDGLVNNAGVGRPGAFVDLSWEDQAQFMELMVTSYLKLMHLVAKPMAERGYGRIINVASLAGYAAGSAGHTLYASVKAGMIKFSESLNAECEALGHEDIHCTALCPGFTWSEFHDANGTREQTNKMPKWMWMDAEPVVRQGIEAVNRGQPVIVPGLVNKGMATLSRILPEPLGRAMVRSQGKRFRKID